MFLVFNISATMAGQRGRLQQEQTNSCPALNNAKMAKEGFLYAAIEDTPNVINKPGIKVPEEKMWGVEFPGHRKVKTAMERHLARVHEIQMDGCVPY